MSPDAEREESDELQRFYSVIYYTLMGTSAVLGGMIVAVVLMLLNAIRELVRLFHPGGSSPAPARGPLRAAL